VWCPALAGPSGYFAHLTLAYDTPRHRGETINPRVTALAYDTRRREDAEQSNYQP